MSILILTIINDSHFMTLRSYWGFHAGYPVIDVEIFIWYYISDDRQQYIKVGMFGTNARDNILFAVTSYAHICSLFIKHLSLKIGFSRTFFSCSAKKNIAQNFMRFFLYLSTVFSLQRRCAPQNLSDVRAFLLFTWFCFFAFLKVLLFWLF